MSFRHLTIREIETIPIRVPLRQVYRGSYYQMTHRATIVTRIHTDEGVTGEAFTGDEDHINGQIERAIRREIAPRLIGQDALAVERCRELARPSTFDILRDRRIGLVACAAVDGAIRDTVGKAVGQPLWRSWGGYRNTIGVIWTGCYYGTDVSIEAEMAVAREAAIAGMKFKVGGLSPEEDTRRFIAARRSAGDDLV
jgi:L-alanine-DL-glutamate epimerase-like enolase superfamily enzyme